VFVIDVANSIVSRLGRPTVAALERRLGADGRCVTCGDQFGSTPLSLRAYHDGREAVTLVAHHAACADSAWLDVGAEVLPRQPTWAAAAAAISLPLGRLRPLRWLSGAASRSQTLPVMFVRPSLEMSRVRQVFPGEAVNADMERYREIGFADLSELAVRVHPLRPICHAWLCTSGHDVSVAAMATEQAWSARAQPPVADLVRDHGGIMIAVACDHDPGRLSTDADYLDRAFGNGEILLGWAQLSPPPRTGSSE
jgi:hypothetical protein